MKSRYASLRGSKMIFIILGVMIVIGITVALLAEKPNLPGAVLAVGADYDIENIGPGQYRITDDTGNVIGLKRMPSDNSVIFQDGSGRRYEFVSGSPYKFIGMD